MNPDLPRSILIGHAGVVLILSVATFAAYGIDKRRAKQTNARRIPEQTLHRLSWLGGAPGGWLGRSRFRHKTHKRGFAIRLSLASLLHAGIAAALAWVAFG